MLPLLGRDHDTRLVKSQLALALLIIELSNNQITATTPGVGNARAHSICIHAASRAEGCGASSAELERVWYGRGMVEVCLRATLN